MSNNKGDGGAAFGCMMFLIGLAFLFLTVIFPIGIRVAGSFREGMKFFGKLFLLGAPLILFFFLGLPWTAIGFFRRR